MDYGLKITLNSLFKMHDPLRDRTFLPRSGSNGSGLLNYTDRGNR